MSVGKIIPIKVQPRTQISNRSYKRGALIVPLMSQIIKRNS